MGFIKLYFSYDNEINVKRNKTLYKEESIAPVKKWPMYLCFFLS